MFANLVTTAPQLAGLQAACSAYNATLQSSRDAEGNDAPPTLLTPAEYWDFVFAACHPATLTEVVNGVDILHTDTEQEVFNRVKTNYADPRTIECSACNLC